MLKLFRKTVSLVRKVKDAPTATMPDCYAVCGGNYEVGLAAARANYWSLIITALGQIYMNHSWLGVPCIILIMMRLQVMQGWYHWNLKLLRLPGQGL